MNRNVSIRTAKMADAPELAAVHMASWRAAYRSILPDAILRDLSVEAFEENWKKHISNANRTNLVLEIEGRVRGFAAFGNSRDEDARADTGELYALYLVPEVWGAGHGRLLWREASERMAERFNEIVVWVLQANARARGFYEGMGFEEEGLVKGITLFGVELPEIRYRRPL